MGKKLSAREVARFMPRRSRGSGKQIAKRRFSMGWCGVQQNPWLALIGLLLSLAVAGCADTSAGSDNDKRGVFYGGVTGGHTWP
jgi:hypothetical protein